MFDFNTQLYAPLRTITEGNLDVFKYGLDKYEDSYYEDPTFIGFTIEIDEQSALFTDVLPFLEKHGGERAEMNARIPVYKEFKNKVVQIFKSQESVDEYEKKALYIKSHYINSVSNLNVLTNKFIKWKEDKIVLELYEDIALFSSYLSSLYNNLIYSYENGRLLIPENLVKFNLYLKFSEIRNFTSIKKAVSNDPTDKAIFDALKNNVTCLTYKLYDCEFDFFKSVPFGTDIVQGGIDASSSIAQSIVPLDIYFKSCSRQTYNPLIRNAIAMNDNKIDLDIVIVNISGTANPNGQITDPSNSIIPGDEPTQSQTSGSISTVKKESFLTTSRKPSNFETYTTEANANPDILDSNDLSGMRNEIIDMQNFNKPLAPVVYDLAGSKFDPLGAGKDYPVLDALIGKDLVNIINDPQKALTNTDQLHKATTLLKQKRNSLVRNFVNDPQKALTNFGNKLEKKIENTVTDQLHKATTLLKQKRNSLVRNFVNDLEDRVGLKRIIPDNVYEDSNYFQNALEQLKSDVGLTIGDELIKTITGN